MREILIYDGDCGFCSRCARFIERHIGTGAQILPWQQAPLADLGISERAATEALQWVDARGRVSAGAVAVARLLIDAGLPWSVAGRLLLVPGLSWLAALGYRLVADNRSRLPGGTPGCAVPARSSGA
jgi:predicted DCC family thiol-disulfide oxidoreductase YuxK